MAAAQETIDPHANWMEVLGGLLRVNLTSEGDILGLVERGVTGKTYGAVVKQLELPKDAVGAETTIRTRLRNESRLNADESERLVRIGRVYAMAVDLFGDSEKAVKWMHRPATFLPGKEPITPTALAARDAGVRLLEEKLQRTAHGMF